MKQTLIALLLALALPASATETEHDIVVYGGTSGGIIAAIQGVKNNRSVVLVSPTHYLGGLTTSGLGWTDFGSTAILGGLSREFYTRVYHHYENPEAWVWQDRSTFGNQGQGQPGLNPATQLASVFEPSVATAVFNQMLADHGVTPVIARLDLENGVVMDGARIRKIRTEDGREFAGKMFIDASYEGDLMAGAGVTFTVGRESNATHNETVNGIQTARATKNQLPNGIDPYVVPGDPSSGLLPGVNPDAGGPDGQGDHRLQAYCFRMCLTNVPENRLPIAQPEGYDEADYEILFRAIEAGQTTRFTKFSPMPNRKTDSNNDSGISNNLIGGNYGDDWNWTTLNHDERLALAKKHENWQRGLLWTLSNHPRVPQTIRTQFSAWGLPLDEFTDNNHWPHQLYIREARRMVSDFVMTEAHCTRAQPVPESIGLAAYTMDSHNVQRHVRNGMVKCEGDVQRGISGPYPVSFRAIVPQQNECENLLVPWSLSASHMAFGSIRMEPVFMILAQSAATAADIAITHDIAVQEIDYPELAIRLAADGQVLAIADTPNEVGILETQPFTTEGDTANPARITLVRTGSTSSSRDVNLIIGGTATPGLDYPAIPTTVTIPAGQATLTLLIPAFADDIVEGDETVIVTIAPGDDYTLATLLTATAILRDPPFDAWRFQHFTAEQLADPLISGPGADPDNDSVSNLGEFFAGSDPLVPDLGLTTWLGETDGQFSLGVLRNPAAAALSVLVEESHALERWDPLDPQPAMAVQSSGGWDILNFPIPAPEPNDPHHFWRIHISEPQPPPGVPGVAFWSFDNALNGTGGGSGVITYVDGFATPPVLAFTGSQATAGAAGGASSFAGPDGNTWLGSGTSTTPGNSLRWNPGSSNNTFSLTISTLGMKDLTVRMDIRSAEQAGGNAPESFNSFTYDIGTGQQPVPVANLTIIQDNQFHAWTADLSTIPEVNNAPQVILRWGFKNLASSPQESVRIDNIVIQTSALNP